jgi:hypothetical protein
LLAAAWIERYQSIPPMAFTPLRALLDNQAAIQASIDDLLARKHYTDEQIPIDRIALLDEFLHAELARVQQAAAKLPTATGDPANLDKLFKQLLISL